MHRSLLGAAAATAAALALAAPAGAATFGSPGLGDPFFPLAGNGGYDVGHYGLTLDYDRSGNRLEGSTLISATATQSLDRFDLDLRGFSISRLDVNGAPATFTRDGQELHDHAARPSRAPGRRSRFASTTRACPSPRSTRTGRSRAGS